MDLAAKFMTASATTNDIPLAVNIGLPSYQAYTAPSSLNVAPRIGARWLLIQSVAINLRGKRQGAYTVASVDGAMTRHTV